MRLIVRAKNTKLWAFVGQHDFCLTSAEVLGFEVNQHASQIPRDLTGDAVSDATPGMKTRPTSRHAQRKGSP